MVVLSCPLVRVRAGEQRTSMSFSTSSISRFTRPIAIFLLPAMADDLDRSRVTAGGARGLARANIYFLILNLRLSDLYQPFQPYFCSTVILWYSFGEGGGGHGRNHMDHKVAGGSLGRRCSG